MKAKAIMMSVIKAPVQRVELDLIARTQSIDFCLRSEARVKMYTPANSEFHSGAFPKVLFGNENYCVAKQSEDEIVVFTHPTWGVRNKDMFRLAGFKYSPYYWTNPSKTSKSPGWKISTFAPGMQLVEQLQLECAGISSPNSTSHLPADTSSSSSEVDASIFNFSLPASKPSFCVFGGENILSSKSEWRVLLPQLIRVARQESAEKFENYVVTSRLEEAESLLQTHELIIELRAGKVTTYVFSALPSLPSEQTAKTKSSSLYTLGPKTEKTQTHDSKSLA